jgi:cytochrome c-type biogenesis protein CcmH/NrfG
MGAYLAGIFIIGAVGYNLNFGQTSKELNSHFLEKIILRQIEKNPNNSHLFNIVGDIRYRRKNYEGTVSAYLEAIHLNPKNPMALNNLAWLYATSEEKRFFDPEKAVTLAEEAVRLSKEPHILDTLAESYYAAKRYQEAISIEEQALQTDKTNRSYYLEQVRKFKEGAKR